MDVGQNNEVTMSQSLRNIQPHSGPRPELITPEFVSILKDAGAVEAFLFGSVARGEEGPTSDIDLLVAFEQPISLVEQLRLMVSLTRLVGRDVDVITNLDPILEPYVRPTLVPIPL
jgi:predicted nucleotidyltransferase